MIAHSESVSNEVVEEEHRKAEAEKTRDVGAMGTHINENAGSDDLDIAAVTFAGATEAIARLKKMSPKMANDRRKWCSRLYTAILGRHLRSSFWR